MKNGRKWKTTQPGQLKWKSREKQVGNRKFVKLRIKKKKSTLAENLYTFTLKKREGLIKEKYLQTVPVIQNYFS